jgi:hypothetical protein
MRHANHPSHCLAETRRNGSKQMQPNVGSFCARGDRASGGGKRACRTFTFRVFFTSTCPMYFSGITFFTHTTLSRTSSCSSTSMYSWSTHLCPGTSISFRTGTRSIVVVGSSLCVVTGTFTSRVKGTSTCRTPKGAGAA